MGDFGLLSPERVSAITGQAIATLMSWRSRNAGPPFVKIGRKVWCREQDLLAWIESRVRVTDDEPDKTNGKWFYRFYALGREWSKDTGLAATKRNESAATMMESEARKLVKRGRADELSLDPKPFSSAADMFVQWAMGEHREKPETWKRLRGSCTSLKAFFGHQPVHTITVGRVQDYMSWRRICTACAGNDPNCEVCEGTARGVAEITLRHDLHALSPLFQYAIDHNWCVQNPVEKVKVPSDRDAIRIHVLTLEEEMKYFAAARAIPHLYDLARLMILQGPRPSEVMQARVEHIDLKNGTWSIPQSKSTAGRRTLKLIPEARAIMEARVAGATPTGWLFEGKAKNSRLTDAGNGHKKILKNTSLAFVLYDLRHTFATRMAERGCDVMALAKILGHANLRTVMRYVHIGQEHLEIAMLKFGDGARLGQEPTIPLEADRRRQTIQ